MMEEVHKGGSSSSVTSQPSAVQGTTLQAAQLSHIAQQMSLRGSAPLTVVQLPGEQVQVQGVIQTAQSSSVIHSPQVQTVQVSSLSESEDSQDSSDSIGSSQKARGILARRPSYRKILKDLSSEDTRERKGDEESPGVSTVTSMSVPTPIYQTSTGQYIAIAANGLQLAGPGADGVQGLQTLTMANAGGSQPGTTILQYAQTSDGQQILVPSNQVVVQSEYPAGPRLQPRHPECQPLMPPPLCALAASGDMQTYQIRTTPTTSSLPQTVVMTSPVTLTSQTSKTDDPQLKREIRLMKNREAARECRRKKKEYVKCLENRVAVLENQNKTLIEELKTLKDLYCHKSV
ncbi:cyclic AMP-dependent transcription factor ATF-1 isoform X1 [Poecile atricapillus]|uniref:cyclic AMP-dependent transcription factor ATF-1 isoform X1 n=2 Tax=Poecile atricapillus TaxID=48891 RepID=UPI00273A24D3|nr:cyclic AMP-dependent transcription factor ATF-1 isoform X1 [Poecile atricapillus]